MTEASTRASRSDRARLSLDGLSIGDGFGQCFFYPWVVESANRDNLPDHPWNYTDDTEMAMAIVQVLEQHGSIDQDALARTFAGRYVAEPGRGYGAGAQELLRRIATGAAWRNVSRELFGGQGSFGNGGAMWTTAWVRGDVDTTCAIVGSIVALAVGPDGIPDTWCRYREPLNW